MATKPVILSAEAGGALLPILATEIEGTQERIADARSHGTEPAVLQDEEDYARWLQDTIDLIERQLSS